MKKLLMWVLLFPFTIFAQTSSLYTVQIGTFVNPKTSDFQALQSIDYLYAEAVEGNFSKVFLGEFLSKAAANRALNQIKSRGFNGFITKRPFFGGLEMPVVQFATLSRNNSNFDLSSLTSIGKLFVVLTDPTRIKIVTGPFADINTARKRVLEIQKLGYKDAFVKTINSHLLHQIGNFELSKNEVKNNLNAAVDVIFNNKQPSNYEANSSIIKTATKSTNVLWEIPKIRPLIKRTSALDLQKTLKAAKYYSGSLDGFYGKKTIVGYTNFVNKDLQYLKYILLTKHFSQNNSVQDSDFQQLISNLPHSSSEDIDHLKASNIPLAKAYQAYLLLVNNGSIFQINQLMNTAIKETFADKKIKNAPPFDYNATYSYEELTQFILHLRYLHAAPKNNQYTMPCWLFEQHPEETMAAFRTKSKFASVSSTKLSPCNNFDTWSPIKIMNTIIKDLQPIELSKDQLVRQKALDEARNLQYIFPEKLDKIQKRAIDKWLKDFWRQLENSAQNHPVLNKNLISLKILFFQSQVLLEDFFMNKEFTPDAAEGLALSVLKTYVEVSLEVYGV